VTDKERAEINGLGLEEKVNYSKSIIREALGKFGNNLVLAWTGGKDSTMMLWLYKQTYAEMDKPLPKCIFINEGDVFDEILELIDRVKRMWNIQVVELKNDEVLRNIKVIGDIVKVTGMNERNRKELEYIDFKEKEFPFEPESYVGNHLMKTVSVKVFIKENSIRAANCIPS